ncbi:MAG TPA: plasma-membrane proton-efflux P-type ATPase [Candidatus Kapabacteria bacterium]|nr:plasma-membrane proton-efflux P-type ATPase [Candidatus Kapabacteria bacterium]
MNIIAPSGSAAAEPPVTETEAGLSSAEAAERLARDGANDIPEPKPHKLLDFARKFWGLSAWMIELIAGLSLFLGKTADFWIAFGLLIVNAVLSFLQEARASSAVAALRKRLQVTARVLRDGVWRPLAATQLVVGDVLRLRSGDFVPADAVVHDGTLSVDQSTLTGESREIQRVKDGTLYSGSVVREGEATARVTATGTRTFYGRTTQLVESAHPKPHVDEVISKVVRWLLLIVGFLVAIAITVSIFQGINLLDILPLMLILLMSAVPVALPVMFTVSMAVGSIDLARSGALVTRLSAAEDAANMDVLCADKTGTLTLNRLSLVTTMPQPGFKDDDIVLNGALASNESDQDPIDLAFLRAATERKLLSKKPEVLSFTPFSAQTRRTEAVLKSGQGNIHVIKGALRTVMTLTNLDATKAAAIEEQAAPYAAKGYRMLAVARGAEGKPLEFIGIALLEDPLRPDSRQLIGELKELGLSVKMLTGDALPVAIETGHELGLNNIVRAPDIRKAAQEGGGGDTVALVQGSDGFAEVFPEDKFIVVKSLQAAGHVVGMTGDGVNDAPALKQAEVGIAVSGATDVAKGAASVVLTTEGLGSIVLLVRIGRAIYQRVLTWIINKISRTILKAGFVVIAFLVTGQFVISALGMILLVFMTDFAKIALSTDRTRASQKPESWNIGPLIRLAVVLGILMLVESLALLAFGWHDFGLMSNPGTLATFSFQTLLFFSIASILSVRERHHFWSSRPGTALLLALGADAAIGFIIGFTGLSELTPIPFSQTAIIVGYATFSCFGINDWVKYRMLKRP